MLAGHRPLELCPDLVPDLSPNRITYLEPDPLAVDAIIDLSPDLILVKRIALISDLLPSLVLQAG